MPTVELSDHLGAPLLWQQPKKVNRHAMALITVSTNQGEKSVLLSTKGMMSVDANNYVLAPKERIKQKATPIRDAISFSGKFLAWIFVAFLLSFSILNISGQIKSQVVLTASMSPSINPGDIVISTSPERISPKVGNVVVYSGKRLDGTKVASFAHRIIAGDAQNGFVVKGDNNPNPDTQKPVLSDIEGVVLFTIPYLGLLLNPQILVLLLLCGFGLWLIVDAFRDEE